MTLTVQAAGRSDVGCVRSNNEDNFGYDGRYGIYLVCDGMGGQQAGEVASKIAVDAVLGYFRTPARENPHANAGKVFEGVSGRANQLATAIQLANTAIHSAAALNAAQQGMGSTIAAVLVEGNHYSVAHVGDSRIYLLRQGGIQQLTTDHSLVMEHVRRGLISVEEAQRSGAQNILLRALGPEETVEPDLSDLVAEAGDVVLLATDGLTVNTQSIAEVVGKASSLADACAELIDRAKQAGSRDNISCLLLRFAEKSWLRSLFGGGEESPKWQDSI